MSLRQVHRYSGPVFQVPPPSLKSSLLGLIIGYTLIAAAIWLGAALRAPLFDTRLQAVADSMQHSRPDMAAPALKIVDAERALVFDADASTGDVRVLNVRNGVSEIVRLHEDRRHDASVISLDADRHVLIVEAADARYLYDTQSFHLLARSPLLTAGQDM
jgi:hypothetical protein